MSAVAPLNILETGPYNFRDVAGSRLIVLRVLQRE